MPPLAPEEVARIVAFFEAAGATAKVSSIHVNGWFGDSDKLGMTRLLLREQFGIDLEGERRCFVFVGDSPNDAPMFGYFPNAVAVANVHKFVGQLAAEPAYVTERACGAGFAELARALIEARSAPCWLMPAIRWTFHRRERSAGKSCPPHRRSPD